MPERKYKVGDHIVTTNKYGGREGIILAVNPKGSKFDYGWRLLAGSKRYGLNEADIAGIYGEVNPHDVASLVTDAEKEKHTKAQALALREAQLADGTPDGDRWLLLATAEIGQRINISDGRKVKPATLTGLRMNANGTRFLAQPFSAKFDTGGDYIWRLSSLVLGQQPAAGTLTKTDPPARIKAGTLGELLAQANHLITVQNLDPNTKLYIAGDAEGNGYNTLYNLQIEQSKRGKVVVVNVNDNMDPEELFG